MALGSGVVDCFGLRLTRVLVADALPLRDVDLTERCQVTSKSGAGIRRGGLSIGVESGRVGSVVDGTLRGG